MSDVQPDPNEAIARGELDAVIDVTDLAVEEAAAEAAALVAMPAVDVTAATLAAVEPLSAAECASAIEALLMVCDQPMSAIELATIIEMPVQKVEATLEQLAGEYRDQGRGFELRNVAQGWRYYSAAHCAEIVSKYATDGRSAKLTQAALETLSVVAYKQPVSRARIGAIRGVSVDGVMRTLLTRGLVAEIETDPHTGAVLYGTTMYFLERMGLESVAELPAIEDHLPDMAAIDALVEPSF